jgi:hypothetical protein
MRAKWREESENGGRDLGQVEVEGRGSKVFCELRWRWEEEAAVEGAVSERPEAC